MRRFLLGIMLTALAAACVYHQPDKQSIEIGDKIPAFMVTMEDGSSLSSGDLLGAPSLLVFFHTTCPDCQRTLPVVQQAYEKYRGKVRFVAISRAQSAAEIKSWWQQNGITLPFSAQEDRKVYELFASSRIPRIYIVNSKGMVEAAFDDNPCPVFSDLDGVLGRL